MEHGVTVELAGLAKAYGRRNLFSGLSALVPPGGCLAVTGPNGSGKSTLLKIVAGLVRPSAGTVSLTRGGRRLAADELTAAVGMVSPEVMFYGNLTGYENLDFLTRAGGVALTTERLIDCCRAVGLEGRANDAAATYSTGMRQRLKFALLLALRPAVWLLDEPSSNLDAAGKRLVAGLVGDALAGGAAMVIATNEAEETAYAARTIELV